MSAALTRGLAAATIIIFVACGVDEDVGAGSGPGGEWASDAGAGGVNAGTDGAGDCGEATATELQSAPGHGTFIQICDDCSNGCASIGDPCDAYGAPCPNGEVCRGCCARGRADLRCTISK